MTDDAVVSGTVVVGGKVVTTVTPVPVTPVVGKLPAVWAVLSAGKFTAGLTTTAVLMAVAAGIAVASVVAPPTNTLIKESPGLAGVSNALIALVRSVLVALAFSPKAKASCFCCVGVRPDTEKVGEKDCNRLSGS